MPIRAALTSHAEPFLTDSVVIAAYTRGRTEAIREDGRTVMLSDEIRRLVYAEREREILHGLRIKELLGRRRPDRRDGRVAVRR
jgi:hypothetical protein